MNTERTRRVWQRWTLLLLGLGVAAAAVFGGRAQASGAPGTSAVPPPDTVVLTGSYSCSIASYSVIPPQPPVVAPTPDPTDTPAPDPETDDAVAVRELTHFISIAGTGALTSPPVVSQAPAGTGPGFGGRGAPGRLQSTPVSLGSGVSTGFDGGSPEDCVRFGEALTKEGVACSPGYIGKPIYMCTEALVAGTRVAVGRVFNWCVARLGLRGVADSQCGFKAFTAAAAERLFGRLRTRGFGFDVELLLEAQAAGYRIAEVGVNWADQAGSKVGVLRHGPGMLWQIATARRRRGKAR